MNIRNFLFKFCIKRNFIEIKKESILIITKNVKQYKHSLMVCKLIDSFLQKLITYVLIKLYA